MMEVRKSFFPVAFFFLLLPFFPFAIERIVCLGCCMLENDFVMV